MDTKFNHREKSPQDVEALPEFFRDILLSSEFMFSEGDLLTRLEHSCYYQLGGLRYPAKVLLRDFFRTFEDIVG